ncbi:MAG: branched-chain alpha-keto acid dehydrogenase subunit E2 [Gammaproteobacteria bacterium RIFCSPHIGHO2_12_FULL_63_22]|nr:MAG: branched-chain alpha-keto acid dehydrogenase subunit E2 [Gammaproteobacteria bacterium RIFCSPHIGHO2_12_FULL_63_22]
MTNKTFFLPDLGEGLPDAEIVEWMVKVGDTIKLDEPLVSMETAKAVVELPSPYSGKLLRVAGGPGDVITTGAWLVEMELDMSLPQRAEAQDTGHAHGAGHAPPPAATVGATSVALPDTSGQSIAAEAAPTRAAPADAGTVVGAMQTSDAVRSETAIAIGGVKAMPAVRALAKKLGVDLNRVNPTGADGVVTLGDVKQAAESGSARAGTAATTAPARASAASYSAPAPTARATVPTTRPAAAPSPMRNDSMPRSTAAMDSDEPIRGVRRNMVRVMSQAHAEVVPTTLMDDADLHAWSHGEDIMARLIRALVHAAAAEPALNAWLNAKEGTLRRHSRVDVGIAVDSPEGLFVPALRNCDQLDPGQVRSELNRLRDGVKNRSLPPDDLTGYTVMLSNFGVFAGKYATPIVVPPCVCIVGAGRLHHAIVPVLGGMETHRMMPLSLTFDHRAATGGEAARFLRVMIDDLQRPH